MRPLALLLLAGCVPPVEVYEVALDLTIDSDQEGPVELWLLQVDFGDGPLASRFQELDRRTLDGPGAASATVDIESAASGVAAYAWQDLDGDGVHCHPDGIAEPSGLAVEDPVASHEVELLLSLQSPCAAPESLAASQATP